MHRMHRPGQRQVGEVHALFDQVEHQRRRTEFEIGRRLRQIRVADDDMQPPVFVGVGVWLANAMIDARKADDCMSSGRRNCNPIEVPR